MGTRRAFPVGSLQAGKRGQGRVNPRETCLPTLTHRYNAVRGQGQAPITVFFFCPICTEYYEACKAWIKHMLAARRSDMPPVRTFDFLERRALAPQAVGRLAVLIQ